MSAGAQANKFYEEVAANGHLWYAEFRDGVALEFDLKNNKVSFPLWSSKSRIERLKRLNPELLGEVIAVGISWEDFKSVFVPMLQEKQRLVGVNLSGKGIAGFDMEISSLLRQVEGLVKKGTKDVPPSAS